MEATGTIVYVGDTQEVSDKFKKREFAIEIVGDNPQYAESVKFEFVQDRCSLLDKFAEGQEVAVEFNLKGRAWKNKQGETQYFNTLQAWKINSVSNGTDKPSKVNIDEDGDSGLPF